MATIGARAPTPVTDMRRIAYLATDAYGGRGGIALYNRDVLDALMRDTQNEAIIVLPRIAGNGQQVAPQEIDWRPAAAVNNLTYLRELARLALFDRPIDLIYCAHQNLLPLADILRRLTGAKLVLAIYGIEAWTPFRRRQSIKALKKVDRILSISDYTARRFVEWSKFSNDRIDIVPNAIRLEDFGMGPRRSDLVDRFGLGGREVVMLFGRMDASERLKGFDELIEALGDIRMQRPAAKLLLAGDGLDQGRLEAKVQALGIGDDVAFTGFVPEAEKADYYRLADAYVMPSAQEGFGFVHLEAMACGIPAVASKLDGAREAVRDGSIGFLIDPLDRSDIVRTTLRALDTPKQVPVGLDYFGFDRFLGRLNGAVANVASQDSSK